LKTHHSWLRSVIQEFCSIAPQQTVVTTRNEWVEHAFSIVTLMVLVERFTNEDMTM